MWIPITYSVWTNTPPRKGSSSVCCSSNVAIWPRPRLRTGKRPLPGTPAPRSTSACSSKLAASGSKRNAGIAERWRMAIRMQLSTLQRWWIGAAMARAAQAAPIQAVSRRAAHGRGTRGGGVGRRRRCLARFASPGDRRHQAGGQPTGVPARPAHNRIRTTDPPARRGSPTAPEGATRRFFPTRRAIVACCPTALGDLRRISFEHASATADRRHDTAPHELRRLRKPRVRRHPCRARPRQTAPAPSPSPTPPPSSSPPSRPTVPSSPSRGSGGGESHSGSGSAGGGSEGPPEAHHLAPRDPER